MSDPEVIRAVVAWAVGFIVLATAGIGVPVLASLVPDAISYWRRRGNWRPAAGITGLAAGVIALDLFQSGYLGAPTTPSKTLWASLTLLLIAGTSTSAGASTVTRALRRRAARRSALESVSQPPRTSAIPTGSRTPPAAIKRPNARDAEYLACDWMHWLGIEDAITTPEQRDGGVDVRSREFLAQVKHRINEPTGVAEIRQLHGVAAAEGRHSLFFTSSSYTRDAIAFARTVHMALFIVHAQEGRLIPHGILAQQYVLHGALNTPAKDANGNACRPQTPLASSWPA